MFVVSGPTVRHTYSIPIQGTDTIISVQVITVSQVVLEGIQSSEMAQLLTLYQVQFLSYQVVAIENLVMAHT